MKKICLMLLILSVCLLTACDNKELISENQVKEAVINHSQAEEDSLDFVKIVLTEVGEQEVYDVKFIDEATVYDYEVDASSGAILTSDKNTYDIAVLENTDEIIDIVLNHADVNKENITIVKAKLVETDIESSYIIEFYNNSKVYYEYKINSSNQHVDSHKSYSY